MKPIAVFAALTLLCCLDARADIYKCTDDDGNLTFQQTPCAEKKPDEAEPEEPMTIDEGDAAEATDVITASNDTDTVLLPEESTQPDVVQVCKKKYRDAIDAIDVEMRQEYSPEQSEAYRQRLQVLTRQLRAC